MSKGDYALRLSEAKGVWVVTVFAGVVAAPAIMAVSSCWTVPDSVSGLALLADATAVWEGGEPGGAACLRIVIVVLWHCVPP